MSQVFAVLMSVGLCCGQVELPDHVIHLARTRDKVRAALADLPNFVCLATTERLASPKPKLPPVPVDTISLDVARIGKNELYSWPGRDTFEDRDPVEMIQFGVFGTGAFAVELQNVFLGGFAVIKNSGMDDIGGRRAYRWDYRIPAYVNGWTLNSAGSTATVGSTGTVWADAANDDVLRLAVDAAEIPPGFPMIAVHRTVEYARVRIGGRDLLLPQTSEDIVEEADGSTNINRTAFSHCRQYAATSTLSFEPKATWTETPIPPKRPVLLPSGLSIPLELDAAMASDSSVVGQAVAARVTGEVRQKGKLWIPAGAIVHGRLRLMSKVTDPYPAYQIGLEFAEMELPDGLARFYASLKSVEPAPAGFQWVLTQETHPNTRLSDQQGVISRTLRIYRAEVPGVGTFFMKGSRFTLPKGMRMLWVTEDPARVKR